MRRRGWRRGGPVVRRVAAYWPRARSSSPLSDSSAARSCPPHSISLPSARSPCNLLGVCRLEMGDLRGARAALAEGVPAIVDIGDRFAIPAGLSALAGLAAKEGRPRAALMLAGAAAEHEHVNHTVPAAGDPRLPRQVAGSRSSRRSAPRRQKLLDEGRRLPLDEAIALGTRRRDPRSPASRAVAAPDPP